MAECSSDFLPRQLEDKQLFSKQFQDDLIFKVVGVNDVVQKFIDLKTTTENENTKLMERKVADSKLRYLIKIICERCNRNDLSTLKSFIVVLDETKNTDLAKQLKLIYDERENAIGIMNRLSKEKNTVESLKREIDRLNSLLEEKESDLDSVQQQKNRLAEHWRQTEAELKSQMQINRKELQMKISDKETFIIKINSELDDLTAMKSKLELEVHEKIFVIDSTEKRLEQKEKELQTAIKESNLLRLEIENLKVNFDGRVDDEKQKMSKEIEELENKIEKKEKCIMELRKNQTMTSADVEEKLRNIYREQSVRLDEQAAIIQAQSTNITQQNEKIDQLMSAVGNLVKLVSNDKK